MHHAVSITANQLWNLVVESRAQRIDEYGTNGYSDPALCLYEIMSAGIHVTFNLTTTPVSAHVIEDQMDPLIRGARQMNNDTARKTFRTLVAKHELTQQRL